MFDQLIHFFTTPDKAWSLVSLPFAVAFVLFFGLYIAIRHSFKTLMLAYVVAFSLFFAYKANGVLMLLLPATVLLSYYLTRKMDEWEGPRRKGLMWLTVAVELLPLLYYKYTNFFIEILNELTRSNFSPLAIILPVGISFYTFQAISYTYLTFFPLLMAGPITRAETLIPQIKHRYHIGDTQVYNGLWLIMSGLLKKALIADYIAQYNNWIFDDPTAYSGFENAMGVLGYTLQIYCDFSGYSDISIGLASLLGIELKENFRQSLNLQEFWHRWHISLSTWFRDYVYIPLGGNRCGKVRTYVNNFITMLVAGLWHGASWMFVIWGALHGIGLVIHKFCKRWLDPIPNSWYVRLGSFLLTFLYICLTWVFFRSADLATAFTIIGRIFSDFSLAYLAPFVETRTAWTVIVVLGFALHAIRQKHLDKLKEWYVNTPIMFKIILLIVILQVVVNYRQNDIQPFIYTQF